MSEELTGLDRIPLALREPVESYVRCVRELADKNVRSLVLFGSVLDGDFDRRHDSIQSVLVLERIELAVLRRLAEKGAQLGSWGIAAPLVMTPEYVKSSLDTFPLELLEIAQRHVTVLGEEAFADLTFADEHVRLQCEREFKRLLIGLRQGLLATGGREKLIRLLEHDAAQTLLRTLRGLLWLRGCREFVPSALLPAEIEKIAGRELPGIRAALDRTSKPGWAEFESLYRDVEAVGEFVGG